jgi:rifampicin phosphotransferase
MTTIFIYSFDQTASLEAVGGKGLNLMRLSQAGMPVPAGFVISTAAYEEFVRHNQLDEMLEKILDSSPRRQSPQGGREARGEYGENHLLLSNQDPKGFGKPLGSLKGESSPRIRAAFEAGKLPEELAEQIAAAYRALAGAAGQADLAVAVRSSATAEDLAEASFAGQQDTYLNVRGEAELLAAVKRCFGSLWSERAIDYRARQGLEPLEARLAVVVQAMVFANAAGVAFTADPLSGDASCLVIDATFGLGEALVSGLVTPDHVLVDKRSGKELLYTVSNKTLMIASAAQGTQELEVPKSMRKVRVLSKTQVKQLARLGLQIEQAYARPMDLEWCLAKGRLYIVQARPITTLPERPLSWAAPGPGKWLHGGGSFEMITEPVSPLFESFLLPIFAGAILQMLAEIGLGGALPAVPYRVVNGFIYLHIEAHLRPWHLPGIIRDFALHLDSMKQQESEQELYRASVARQAQPPVKELSSEEILARMQALGEAGMHYWLQIMKLVQVIYRQEKAFTDFYTQVRRPGDPAAEIFLRGQKIMAWQAECSSFELAQQAREQAGLMAVLRAQPANPRQALAGCPGGAEFLNALEAHLAQYGHQLSSFDLSLPTLADDPRPVLAAVLAYLDGKESPIERQERMQAECAAAVAAVSARLAPRERKRFAALLAAAQAAGRTREDALFDVGLAWTPLHRCALELGERLARAGTTARAGDIFWLSLEEIRAGLGEGVSSQDKVTMRLADQAAWSQVSAPYLLPQGSRPDFWWKWIFPTPELQRHPDGHTLVGLGVSPGKVTGVARVIHSLDEFQQLNPGELLVARTTTPAWTPLFARAAGLVTDLGGPLAHGSIVAREVGIPAVMGTGSATQKIRSGQVITILGSEGKVIINK